MVIRYLEYSDDIIAAISDASERRVMAALRASKIGVFEFEPATNTAFWDDRIRALWGIHGTEAITYEIVVAQVHPDDRALHDAETQKALDPTGDGQMDMIYRLYPRDGHPMRWVRATAECYFENGQPVRLVGTVQDITKEQTAVLQNRMLLNELQHRVKNTLATAIAVVSLSRRGATDMRSYLDAVDERLRSLSISHDVLRKSDWTSVQFADLFSTAAGSFLGSDWQEDRISLKAGHHAVPAQNVMTMSMALHELMTNAAKYGALSTATGQIEAGFRHTEAQSVFYWRETGGPRPTPDAGKAEGFGSILLREIFPGEMGGTAEMTFSDKGLSYEVSMPPVRGLAQ